MTLRPDNATTFGFRIVGPTSNDRRLINWPAAFGAYADCDTRAEIEREAYLSAFCFGDDFAEHLNRFGSVRGFEGATWSPWVWFDIDRPNLDAAVADCRRLVAGIEDRYRLDDGVLVFFSGSKGFHCGLPTSLFGDVCGSTSFHLTARRFAETTAARHGVAIDTGVYDRVRPFRAPNSRHPKTGRHKRRLTAGELLHLNAGRIVELAANPEPFEVPDPPESDDIAAADWREAVEAVERDRIANRQRRESKEPARLNRATLAFIRDGATEGDRHRLLFSAAANLAEFGCSADLAFSLLGEIALDSGLSPSDVRRQIALGLAHTKGE
jgi:hypothetical protein